MSSQEPIHMLYEAVNNPTSGSSDHTSIVGQLIQLEFGNSSRK